MKDGSTDVVLKLLVVDDEEQNVRLIEEALTQDGVKVISTTDPEKGYSMFIEERPETVLLDLKMPKIGGIDLLEKIVAVDPTTEVILMTGHYTPESAVQAIQKGAADYITKPLNLDMLRARISASLSEAERRARALELDRELVDTFR